MTEFNPNINMSELRLIESKIILGSFPTWTIAISNNKQIDSQKELERIKNNDIRFFFGSSGNKFWDWYKVYLDNNILVTDVNSIKESLKKNSVGITDLIISCNRKGKSALDKHLTKRVYNHHFFRYPKNGEKLKVICTSKGLMNSMFLSNNFFKNHPKLSIDLIESAFLQDDFIKKVKGNSKLIKNPFCTSIKNDIGGIIECVSIPSPGSPYRRLMDFGCESKDLKLFLDSYLRVVFNWFEN